MLYSLPMMTRTQGRYLLLGLFLLSLVGVSVALLKDRKAELSDKSFSVPSSSADISLSQFDYSEMRSGKIVWTLRAERGGVTLEDQVSRLEQARLQLFDVGSMRWVNARAALGTWRRASSELELTGDVLLDTSAGHSLRTETLFCRLQEQVATAPGPVRFRAPGWEVSGDSMVADLSKRSFAVTGHVSARLVPAQTGGEG